jgi:hypothetical protein
MANQIKPRTVTADFTLEEDDLQAGAVIVDSPEDVLMSIGEDIGLGTVCVIQRGVGRVCIDPSTDIIRPTDEYLVTAGQGHMLWLVALGNDEWALDAALPAVPPVPVPGPEPGGLVVAHLTVEGVGEGPGMVVSFGHVFCRGDVLAEESLIAHAGGVALRTQYEPQTYHPDGSTKHALLAVELPALADGEALVLELITGGSRPGTDPDLDLEAMLADGREATLSIFGHDINLLAFIPEERTRSGPLLTEARVDLVIEGVRILADIQLTKTRAMMVDLAVRNDIGFHEAGGTVTYDLILSLDFAEVHVASAVTQVLYTAYQRRFWSNTPKGIPNIWHDVAYLVQTGLVPNYDVQLGVSPERIDAMLAPSLQPAWNEPLNPRGIQQYMPGTGGREDIGIVPNWVAAWLLTGDRRLEQVCHDNAEASGAIPWHIWDGENASWANVDHRGVDLWLDARYAGFYPQSEMAGWTLDVAHAPDACGVLYALTGRRSLLDNLSAEGAYVIGAQWQGDTGQWAARGVGPLDYDTGEGVNLLRQNQQRGAAWGLRAVFLANLLQPAAAQPTEGYFARVLQGNMNWLHARKGDWQADSGEPFGYLREAAYGSLDVGEYPPWQHDYLTTTLVRMALAGDEDAAEYLLWAKNFHAGRFLQDQENWHNPDGVNYRIWTGPTNTLGYKTWADMKARMLKEGSSSGPAPADYAGEWNQGNYGLWGLASIAMSLSLWPTDPDLLAAWAFLTSERLPASTPAEIYSGGEQHLNIMPPGQTRGELSP